MSRLLLSPFLVLATAFTLARTRPAGAEATDGSDAQAEAPRDAAEDAPASDAPLDEAGGSVTDGPPGAETQAPAVPLGCDGALCDTTNGAECSAAPAPGFASRGAAEGVAGLLFAFAVAFGARSSRRSSAPRGGEHG